MAKDKKAEEYGEYYWCVQLGDREYIRLFADDAEVTSSGDLIFTSGDRNCEYIVHAVASGQWKQFYRSTIVDGVPVAVSDVRQFVKIDGGV